VVVHHARGLHEGVANRGADERESAFLQIFAHGVGLRGARGDLLRSAPGIHDWRSANKLPDVGVERSEFFLRLEKCFCVFHGGGNLQAIADDAGVVHQALHLAVVVARDLVGIEAVEGGAIVFTLLQNSVPAQAGLRAFEN